MQIESNKLLRQFTSFYVGGEAEYFALVRNIDDLKKAIDFAVDRNLNITILSGGSNVLISDEGIRGLVIKPDFKRVLKEKHQNHVIYKIGSGENWDRIVEMAVNEGFYGIENLSHIPGSVGGAVVQNIGAYGQEIGPVVISVEVFDKETREVGIFASKDLNFGYRKSIFNNESRGRYVIISVSLQLHNQGEVNTKYGDVKKYFVDHGILSPSLADIRQAIVSIRDSKFPYPDSPDKGTAGSFFNALPVNEETFDQISAILISKGLPDKASYLSSMKDSFKVAQGFKIPYGILIESLGLKGKAFGGAKILETHAGVIINYTGSATAGDIYKLACFVKDQVKQAYNVDLSFEPELMGNFL